MATKPPKNGLHTDYHDNAQKKSEGNVKDSKKDGKRILRKEKCITFYDENREDQIKEIADWIVKNAKK